MKILIVGSGAREHALAWAIRKSPLVKELFCAPGNAGIARLAECAAIDPSSIIEMAEFAAIRKIDLTIVGPELPLSLGIVDEFRKRGLTIFGPTRAAAEIEASKVFAKEFMKRHGIPTAEFAVADSAGEARAILRKRKKGFPVVLKADGLAAGKGVVVAADAGEADRAIETMLVERRFGQAGSRVLIEDCLAGLEVSFFALSDGERVLPLETCQDYKRLGDGDTGPNTGGMGGYSPSVHVDAATFRSVRDSVLMPAVGGLAREGRPYQGVLYAGLMLTREGPMVLEFNARFGDPEAELIAVRLECDLVPVLQATVAGGLDRTTIAWRKERAVCVVLASSGYPGAIETGRPIEGLDEAEAVEGVHLFHAATRMENGGIVTAGGRVLTVTATGASYARAAERCYAAAGRVRFAGKQLRSDIARDAAAADPGAASSPRPGGPPVERGRPGC
jgi:phosphoribosylamine--glycine ligase